MTNRNVFRLLLSSCIILAAVILPLDIFYFPNLLEQERLQSDVFSHMLRISQSLEENHNRFTQRFELLKQKVESDSAPSFGNETDNDIFWGVQVYKNDSLMYWNGYTLPKDTSIAEKLPLTTSGVEIFDTVVLATHSSEFISKFATRDTFLVKAGVLINQFHSIPFAKEWYSKKAQPGILPTRPAYIQWQIGEAPPSAILNLPLRLSEIHPVGTLFAEQKHLDEYGKIVQSRLSILRVGIYFILLLLFFFLILYAPASIDKKIRFSLHFFLFLLFSVAFGFFSMNSVLAFAAKTLKFGSFLTHPLVYYLLFQVVVWGWMLFLYREAFHIFSFLRSSRGLGVSATIVSAAVSSTFLHVNELLKIILAQTDAPFFSINFFPEPPVALITGLPALLFLILYTWMIMLIRKAVVLGSKPIVFVALFSFFITGMSLSLFGLIEMNKDFISWVFALSGISFYGISSSVGFGKNWFQTLPRKVLISCIVLVFTLYPTLQHSIEERSKLQLKAVVYEAANSFEVTDERVAESILRYVESAFNGATKEEMSDKKKVQTRLNEILPAFADQNREEFSVDVRIVSIDGEELGGYSTDITTPVWVRNFDKQTLEITYNLERIRKPFNRPVIRTRSFEEQPYQFASFKRGWMAIYSPEDSPNAPKIAWILCTVFKENPSLTKPIRSALVSKKNPAASISAKLIHVKNNIPVKETIVGRPAPYPYQITNFKAEDITFEAGLLSYNVFRQDKEDSTAVIGISPAIGNDFHLFILVKLFYFLFFFVSCFFILRWIFSGFKSGFFGSSNRFKQNITDRYLFVIIAFLGVIILLTQTIFSEQQRVQTTLSGKETLVRIAELLESEAQERSSQPSLAHINLNLSVDAALFKDVHLFESTTRQIYAQQLIPDLLPYNIQQIHDSQIAEVTFEKQQIAGEELLTGFARLKQFPDYFLAIPFILNPPGSEASYLETISFILKLYLPVFLIFMIIASLISSQAARSIEKVKIRLDEMKLTGEDAQDLPVPSGDEIGALTESYNQLASNLKNARSELVKAEREAAWKEMAQQVAHEIRNPLTPIRLTIQHLQRKFADSKTGKTDIKQNIDSAASSIFLQLDALDKIASDFSTFSASHMDSFEPCDINDLCRNVATLYSNLPNVQFHLKAPQQKLTILAKPKELNRALVNLIKNALEAIDKAGQVEMVVYSEALHAIIEIRDNGIGISETELDEIFLPKFSTKTSGSGLGLAISKKIIEEHSGTISVTSEPGSGSTFKIALPLSNP